MTGLEGAIFCLAITLYHESRGEPEIGQRAVAMVVMNRAEQNYKNVCNVVFKDHQFTWANGSRDVNGKLFPRFIPKSTSVKWKHSKQIARSVINHEVIDFTGGATHYYAAYIKQPDWTVGMVVLGKWGNQFFFKEAI